MAEEQKPERTPECPDKLQLMQVGQGRLFLNESVEQHASACPYCQYYIKLANGARAV